MRRRSARGALGPRGALGLLAVAAACNAGSDPPGGPAAYPNRRMAFPSADRRLAYVANGRADTISVVDLDAMEVLGTVPIGRDPVDLDGPTGLAIDAGRGLLYVALSYPPGSHVSHGAAPRAGYVRALALADLRPLGELRVDPSPSDLALSDDGATLAVTHYDLTRAGEPTTDIAARRAALVVVDPADAIANGGANARRTSLCVAPYAIVLGPTAARAFVACTGEDALAVVDPRSGDVVAGVPAGDEAGVGKPYALVADRAHGELLLSNRASHQVIALEMGDAPTRRFTVEVPGVPYFAARLSDARLVVPTQEPSGAALLDAASGEVLAATGYGATDCLDPRQALVSRDGRLFLLCAGDGNAPGAVVRLDPTTLAIAARVEVGLGPDRMAVVEP